MKSAGVKKRQQQMAERGDLTSLVFHLCLSFGNVEHFGRHSSSFLGRYIFKCPCSSAKNNNNGAIKIRNRRQ